ncbi:glycosyltransferase involved in cell wall biosynthesis [Skermanella aerolata]|uniref:glycosyltransferase family 4 protein n=1 Tax=Skermanella aerolata TaxID=393310 RepID=UPI003D20444E
MRKPLTEGLVSGHRNGAQRAAQASGQVDILVVGQTPPPYGGQAVLIAQILTGEYRNARLHHVRMSFSSEMSAIGRVGLAKIWELLRVIAAIYVARLKTGSRVLYYPPAGPSKVPMLRDLAILVATRWMFNRTILHFHAGGVSQLYDGLPAVLRSLYRVAYFDPDVTISQSLSNPDDGGKLRTRREFVVAPGIPDMGADWLNRPRAPNPRPNLLFVGVLCEEKGVMVLLDAVRRLRDRGHEFDATLVGCFQTPEFETECRNLLARHGLGDRVEFTGVLTGDAKWRAFHRADIFCFPSFFSSESFGLVVAEAMSFALPVVATRWRGIPDLVGNLETGLLVPIQDAEATALAVKRLLGDPDLRRRLGGNGRRKFLERFTEDRFRRDLDQVFASLQGSPDPQPALNER